jgi:hypothetical protein
MLARQHRGNTTRLLSAVVALALVMAQVIGAYAHAAEHDHASAHAACAHQHGHAAAVPAADNNATVDKIDHEGDRTHHSTSCDFCCHGGIAILVTAAFAYVNPTPPHSSAIVAAVHPAIPPSLERPPRSSARA